MEPESMMRVAAVLLALPLVAASLLALSFRANNRNNGSIQVAGERREYLVHLPPRYDRARAVPLVLSMHGAGGWPAQQMRMTRWNDLADREGFIVVYPSGADRAGPRIWRTSDVRYIAALIDRLEADYAVDRSRIYANGFSNGGGMASMLSCTMSDRLAAVGLVGAAHTVPWRWCRDPRPVPMISIHGTADRFAPYLGGPSPVAPDANPFPSIAVWASKWAARNHCASSAVLRTAAVTRRTWSNCTDNADVVLETVTGAGHQWIGGEPLPEYFVGPDTRAIDTTAELWSFFRTHRLSVAPAPPPAR
jgi:polyhydroxybutyrate depolymerase